MVTKQLTGGYGGYTPIAYGAGNEDAVYTAALATDEERSEAFKRMMLI